MNDQDAVAECNKTSHITETERIQSELVTLHILGNYRPIYIIQILTSNFEL